MFVCLFPMINMVYNSVFAYSSIITMQGESIKVRQIIISESDVRIDLPENRN